MRIKRNQKANKSVSAKPKKPTRSVVAIIVLVSPLFADIGCQHIGPGTIVSDRLDYNKAVLTSWEQQTLLNIVRVRYHDVVSFVDVGSVSQTHSLMGTASATLGATLNPWNIITSTLSPSLMGGGSTTDSPVIAYTPLTGADFIRNLNVPLRPIEICNLIESGYNPQLLMNMTMYSINEIKSDSQGENFFRGITSDEFINLTSAIQHAHRRSELSFQVQPGASNEGAKIFMLIADKDENKPSEPCPQNPKDRADQCPVALIREKLHLRAAETKFEIVAGSRRGNDNEIAVRTRTVIGAMIWLSYYVDAPGAVYEPMSKEEKLTGDDRPLKVICAPKKPHGMFAAVQYNGNWFWIDPKHQNSKSSLIYLRILLALADTGPKPPPPVLTIPVR